MFYPSFLVRQLCFSLLTGLIVFAPVMALSQPEIAPIRKVKASDTPSGLPVPRYVSLKVGWVNGRKGPSLQHDIIWHYQRRGLPLIIIAETEGWRKIRDINGDECWIHKPALSSRRMAIAQQGTILYKKPSHTAQRMALIEPHAQLQLTAPCQNNGWCHFKGPQGRKGWARQNMFWGTQPL